MSDTGKKSITREMRRLWAVDDYSVRFVNGYSCAPMDPDDWWCPEIGFSGRMGCHVFEAQKDALDALIKQLKAQIARAESALDGAIMTRKTL